MLKPGAAAERRGFCRRFPRNRAVEVGAGEFAGADDGVDLLAGGGDAGRVLEEVVERCGDDAGRGAGADGLGHDLV